MARTLSIEAANAALTEALAQKYGDRDVLRGLPAGADPELTAQLALRWFTAHTWVFARSVAKLPAPLVRAIRGALEQHHDANAIIVRHLVDLTADDDELLAQWRTAMAALLDLDSSYEWGSAQNKAKLRGLAASPRVLEALQAAAATGLPVNVRVLAALAVDGSEASCDALLPHFVHAAKAGDEHLSRLTMLEKHASDTPGMRALLAQVGQRLEQREAQSPALALAAHLGFEVDSFWFEVGLHSREPNQHAVSRLQGGVRVDSRKARWFDVWLGEVDGFASAGRHSRFGSGGVGRDELGLGVCTPQDLPRWIASTAQKLGVTWRSVEPRTNLRGKKKEALHAWLRGG